MPRRHHSHPIVAVVLLSCCMLFAACTTQRESAATVILVRHAEKAAPSGDPPLDDAGRLRAQELARVLADVPIAAIFASQYRRTKDTVAPLSERSGVPVTVVPVEDVERSSRELAERIRTEFAGTTVVVAGHSNTVPSLIVSLGGEAVEIADTEYDDLFVVHAGGRVTLRLKYGAVTP